MRMTNVVGATECGFCLLHQSSAISQSGNLSSLDVLTIRLRGRSDRSDDDITGSGEVQTQNTAMRRPRTAKGKVYFMSDIWRT